MNFLNKTTLMIMSACLIAILIIEGLLIYKSKEYLIRDSEKILLGHVNEESIPIENLIISAESTISTVSNIIDGTINLYDIKNDQIKIDKYEKNITPILKEVVRSSVLKNVWYQANTPVLGGVSLIGIRQIGKHYIIEPKWDIIGSKYEKSEWWTGPRDNKEHWTDLYYYAPWKKFLTSFGKRIDYNGVFLGIVSVDIPVDDIKIELAKVTLYKNGFLVLFDEKLNYIYVPYKEKMKFFTLDNNFLKTVKENLSSSEQKNGIGHFEIENKKNIFGYKKLSNGWTILAVVPNEEVIEKSSNLMIYIILLCLTIIFLIGIISFYFIGLIKKQYAILANSYHYDSITELPNRVMLVSDLDNHKKSTGGYLIVMHISNIFEIFNIIGYSKSDTVLQIIAKYLCEFNINKSIKTYSTYSLRFAFLLTNSDDTSLQNWVTEFKNYIDYTPIFLENKNLTLKTTFGIRHIEHDSNGETIINEANKALEFAHDNFNDYCIYTNKLENIFFTTMLVSQVKEAINNNEFYLEYQPKLNLTNNKIEEAEALIRWNHSKFGLIPPNEFIPKLEKTDTIVALTNWVILRVLKDMNEWDSKGIRINVAINITPRDLKNKRFESNLYSLMEFYKIDYDRINLEITETDFIKEIDNVLTVIKSLKDKGIKISIDDFGTGYSSLSYINTLPIDCIKVDRSFIKNLLTNSTSNKLLNDTISLLHNLGKTVVAEGVEDLPTMTYLNDMGCEEIQGYYISRPIGKEKLEIFLENFGK